MSLYTPYNLIGSGKVKMRRAGSTDPMLDVGNVLALSTDPQTREVSVPNLRGGGGKAFSKKLLDALNVKLTFANLDPANIARVQGGTTSELVAGTFTSDEHTAQLGGFIALGLLDSQVAVVVQDATDTTTYLVNVDYDLSGTGITPLADGNIADASEIHISGGTVNADAIELFINSGLEWEVMLDGVNDADGSSYFAHFYRWTAAPSAFDVLGEEVALLESEGESLPDASKPSGSSQFGVIQIARPV